MNLTRKTADAPASILSPGCAWPFSAREIKVAVPPEDAALERFWNDAFAAYLRAVWLDDEVLAKAT